MRLLVAGVLVLAAAPAAARGGGVAGDGNVTAQKRDVPAFDAVRLETFLDVVVKVGPPRSVTVRLDGNLQELLTTTVENGVLVIDATKALRPTHDGVVEIELPELRRFHAEGSGEVTIEGGKGPLELALDGSGNLRWRGEASALRATIEGSGDLRLEGRAETLRVTVEGSGDVDSTRLSAVNAEARVEGSGNVELSLAGGSLSAAVEGSGDILWRGETRAESVAVHGSGEVSRRK
ncbi:MAG TPA: head GIN domain-containing protein [Anaeromyxobacter sp.]|nr:head GIN domain-containing protein [Anaeromyxobacter sp.]